MHDLQYQILVAVAFLLSIIINGIFLCITFSSLKKRLVLLLLGSFLTTISIIILAFYSMQSSPVENVRLISFAGELVVIALLILIFHLPDYSSFQRILERIALLSSSVPLAFLMIGSFYPEHIAYSPLYLPEMVFFTFIPVLVSFLVIILAFVKLVLSNKSIIKSLSLPEHGRIFAIITFIIFIMSFFVFFDNIDNHDKISILVLFYSVLTNISFVLAVLYYPQRFPSRRILNNLMKNGAIGWLMSIMDDDGPRSLAWSESFVACNSIDQTVLDQVTVHVISLIGLGKEDEKYDNLSNFVLTLSLKEPMLILVFPSNASAEFEDERFQGSTVATLSIFLPARLASSLNIHAIELPHFKIESIGHADIEQTVIDILSEIYA